jgi:YfiH family protein
MHNWTWQTWKGKAYLTCDLLKAWPHGFFTQHFAPETPEALVRALHPEAEVYRTQQVHGNVVLSPAEIRSAVGVRVPSPEATVDVLERPPADGSFSNEATQSVWVCTADCTPALIGDVRTGQVAAVHAGWRGTAQRIVPIAIERLQAQGRSQLADIRVALGPAIAGVVYQVGTDVAAAVAASVVDELQSPTTLVAQLQTLENPPILDDTAPGCVRLDVRRVNELQLMQLGLAAEQIAIAPHCTYQEPEHFFSYRRTRQKQVQWSGIVSR